VPPFSKWSVYLFAPSSGLPDSSYNKPGSFLLFQFLFLCYFSRPSRQHFERFRKILHSILAIFTLLFLLLRRAGRRAASDSSRATAVAKRIVLILISIGLLTARPHVDELRDRRLRAQLMAPLPSGTSRLHHNHHRYSSASVRAIGHRRPRSATGGWPQAKKVRPANGRDQRYLLRADLYADARLIEPHHLPMGFTHGRALISWPRPTRMSGD
jgi:hypothetical protein